jgi:hypothetical protein
VVTTGPDSSSIDACSRRSGSPVTTAPNSALPNLEEITQSHMGERYCHHTQNAHAQSLKTGRVNPPACIKQEHNAVTTATSEPRKLTIKGRDEPAKSFWCAEVECMFTLLRIHWFGDKR